MGHPVERLLVAWLARPWPGDSDSSEITGVIYLVAWCLLLAMKRNPTLAIKIFYDSQLDNLFAEIRK